MGIESLRHYLLTTLPPRISGFFSGQSRALQGVPPAFWLALTAFLVALLGFLLWRIRRDARRERARTEFFRQVAEAPTMQQAITALDQFLRRIEPDLRDVGVYLREEGGAFRLAAGGGSPVRDKDAPLAESISPEEGHQRQGRFHLYTFHPSQGRVAVRLVSYNPIAFRRLTAELYSLSALLEGLAKLAGAQSELAGARLADESASIFNPGMSDRRDYLELVGTIVLNAYRLDTLRISSPDGDAVLGAPGRAGSAKLLHLRNTQVTFELFRVQPLTTVEISQIGKFLDLVSAVLALYSSEEHAANYLSLLEAAVEIYESNSPFEKRHSEKVRCVALPLGKALGLDDRRLAALGHACRFHDIGMLGQLAGIAAKHGNLSEQEHARIKYHPNIGRNITKALDVRHPVSAIIQQHHEFLDGSGYPEGIGAAGLSTEAKILALSEVLVGMVSERPYRGAKELGAALKELEAQVPKQLDPAVFGALKRLQPEIALVLKALA